MGQSRREIQRGQRGERTAAEENKGFLLEKTRETDGCFSCHMHTFKSDFTDCITERVETMISDA